MTVPVSSWVSKNDAGETESREMCFFIGAEFQETAPKPTDPDVYLNRREAMTVVTRRISGYPKEAKWAEEYETVKRMAGEKGIEVEEAGYYQNGYDAPMKFINRRNEVWLVVKKTEAKDGEAEKAAAE